MTHNKAVEELVHHQTEQADRDVANWIDKVEVPQYLLPRFGKCAVIAHHTHGQDDTIQHLTHHSLQH